MSNLPKMSKRATEALNVLGDGGRFRYGLERNSYTGREQFQWRLEHARGGRVPGIGRAAYTELCAKGFAFRSEQAGFTGIATYYHLKSE